MGRREKPLSGAAEPLSAFAAGLRDVRAAAGSPSYRTLADRTHFSVATLSRAAAGNTLPSREVTEAFVAACGGDVASWLAERERVAQRLRPLNPDALTATRTRIAQLPADIGDFSGRAEQVAFLRNALIDGADRPGRAAIAAVTGSGGVGKTSLAVAVAHRLAGRFPDGQLFVDLHGMGAVPRDPADVLRGWLAELEAPAAEQSAGTEALAARFRSLLVGRRMLIVIDNARDAAHVSGLLPATAGCAVLATSRNRLAELPGAVRLDLEPLSEFEALAMLERIVGAERLRAEPAATSQMLRACAGLPLALRIAGARLRARPGWSVTTLAALLADQNRRLDELRIGDLAARTSFEVSFRALPRDTGTHAGPDTRGTGTGGIAASTSPETGGVGARETAASANPNTDTDTDTDTASPPRLFALLGLATGPSVSTAAAAALAGVDERRARQALEILVDAHLVQTSQPGRYHLHDLLRDFAAELAVRELEPQARSAAVVRYVRWYIDAATAAADLLPSHLARPTFATLSGVAPRAVPVFATVAAAQQWFGEERRNLLAAVTLADAAIAGPEAQILAAQTAEYLFAEMLWSDQVELFLLMEQRARRTGDLAGGARASATLAFALARLRRLDEALDVGRRCVAAAEQLQDPRILNNAYTAYGSALEKAGRPEQAATLIEQALTVSRGVGEPGMIAKDLMNLGLLLRKCGRPAEGDRRLTEAATISRAAGESFIAAYATSELGVSRRDQGDGPEAVRLLTQAANLREAIGDRTGRAESLLDLSSALLGLGRHTEARAAWEEASLIVEDVDDAYLRELRTDLALSFDAARPNGI